MMNPDELANYPLDKWHGAVKEVPYLQDKVINGRPRILITRAPYVYSLESSHIIARALRNVGAKLGGVRR